MNWPNWKNYYYQIVRKLEINPEDDDQSAQLLETFFAKFSAIEGDIILQKLEMILKKPMIIAGAGPSLQQDFSMLFSGLHSRKVISNFQTIAVNGATTLFHEKNVIPSIVITDLDGDLSSIIWAINNGALTLIHAHGDNQQQISSFTHQYYDIISKNDVWGTTQCKPRKKLYNFGGFTDGDRAIFLAFHFQSPLIGLIGFDFGSEIGKYSILNSPVKKSVSRKLEKFQIALELIASFHYQHNGLRFNLTRQGHHISGFPRINLTSFLKNWF